MRAVVVEGGFEQWRETARGLLAEEVRPEEILWEAAGGGSLFGETMDVGMEPKRTRVTVTAEFLGLAETVSHHADPGRWGLLYRVLWRMTLGGERALLQGKTDRDVMRLLGMRKAIGRDVHKMHAFVRFKKVGEDEQTGREQFVAWFEPEHYIVPLAAGFFRKRFAGMDWSIFTPTGSAHWNGKRLELRPGVASMRAPDDVELEDLWRSYYKSIFNPARVKVKAMQSEMPKKYWKNLPEAGLIRELVHGGAGRVQEMMEEEERGVKPMRKNAYLARLKELDRQGEHRERPGGHPQMDWNALKAAAACCRACPLHEAATGTVFGEGPLDARIVVVGEQPGDEEDLTGRAFVGPAGTLLDELLEEAGLVRRELYLTNAVKHFKWRRDGKRRLHQNPNAGEVSKCRPWLLAELERIQPGVVICLGGTAAKSLIDPEFRILRQRGLVDLPALAPRVIATVHPSYLLRLRSGVREERQRIIAELRLARDG